jgi:hypothetical protein
VKRMAKIISENIVITFSKILKDNESDSSSVIDSEIQAALEQVTQELVGPGIVVEVVKA